MAEVSFSKITKDGLWNNNPALVQVLGLCPLLAVTGSFVNALGLGLATVFVLTASNILVSLIRNLTNDEVRLPAFVMIIASVTTCIELLMQAYTFELYEILGIFIPLIVTNCNVLGRADAFASKHSVIPAALDGFMMGCGFLAVLVTLGAMREIIGMGTLFSNMHLLFGDAARNMTIVFSHDYKSFLFAVLPPGAFVGMGILMAIKNVIDDVQKERAKAKAPKTDTSSRRVRVTGHIT